MVHSKILSMLAVGLMLGVAPARADVDISSMPKVEVSDWAGLKAALEDPANKDKAIVLTKDIQADKNNPINMVAATGIIIDGGGKYTITGQEGSFDGQFIDFGYSDKTDLIIQNINIEGFGNVQTGSIYARGGAIHNNNSSTIGDITGDFTSNYAQSSSSAEGGAIYNDYGTIGDITGNFSNNFALGKYAYGGAIYNSSNSTIGNITGDFTGNFAKNDSGSAYGGAIYNQGNPITLINSSFYNNYVETGATKESYVGQATMGGAIFSMEDLTIKADNGQSVFSGNKVKWSNGEDSSAIMMMQRIIMVKPQNMVMLATWKLKPVLRLKRLISAKMDMLKSM